ncbi:hypothetical protein SAMN00790413_06176 [Deinococcus hopiensis KR-140]|uniref:Uncharacterized protein n=1 Tax=Deinococcus hopiensis KR-140 TaxID=695939 RepID=A0A1W1VU24_9DEIO|nr:hypothetical protein SAMN00790413_06176 [Deinococcus hopiensis KR-140]
MFTPLAGPYAKARGPPLLRAWAGGLALRGNVNGQRILFSDLPYRDPALEDAETAPRVPGRLPVRPEHRTFANHRQARTFCQGGQQR